MAEKNVNEISREVRMLYQKGNDALIRENYDYAVDLFNQVLENEPTLFECPQSAAHGAGKEIRRQRRILQEGLEQRQFLADGGQSSDGAPKRSRRGAADRRADSQWRSRPIPARTGSSSKPQRPWTCRERPCCRWRFSSKNSPKDKVMAIEFANSLADKRRPDASGKQFWRSSCARCLTTTISRRL